MDCLLEVAKKLATERYREFDLQRRKRAALEADEADISELEALAKQSDGSNKND